MKDCHARTASLLLFTAAVFLQSATAFKIPGFSSLGSQSPAGPPGRTAAASNAGPPQKSSGEYMGPVFIIRELDKEQERYDTFITTGGIQEVRPPGASFRGPNAGANGHGPQKAGGKPEEDSEYFGVLVTSDTVGQINFPSSLFLNVSMSTLLKVVSSRMPWLLVLRRSSHSDLQLGGPSQQQQQQQLLQQQQKQIQQQLQQQQPPASSPLSDVQMQVPQRRRYYGPGDRQRRAAEPTVVSERELLTTMCYNFARELGSPARPPHTVADPTSFRDFGHRDVVHLDVDAYAAAAAQYEPQIPFRPQQQPQQQQPQQEQQRPEDDVSVPMVVPKRVDSS